MYDNIAVLHESSKEMGRRMAFSDPLRSCNILYVCYIYIWCEYSISSCTDMLGASFSKLACLKRRSMTMKTTSTCPQILKHGRLKLSRAEY